MESIDYFFESYFQAAKRTESSWEMWVENLNKIWDREDNVAKKTPDIGGRLDETGFEIKVDDAVVQLLAW